MPSEFPGRPKLLKGALVAYESQFVGVVPNVIAFQFNPNELRRTLAHRSTPPDADNVGESREDTHRVFGPPVETIDLTVELDAADQLEEPETHQHAVEHGLHPALAALELLLYPESTQVIQNSSLAESGAVQISKEGEAVPLVLFVWGRARVLPVRLTDFSVTEQAYDQQLNPIRAEVELGMRVLTYIELTETGLGRNAYMATQIQKEVLARLNLVNSAEQIIGNLPF